MTENLPSKNKKQRRIFYLTTIFVFSIAALFCIKFFLFPKNTNTPVNLPVSKNTISRPVNSQKKENEVMEYIYNGPESGNDIRYTYHWEILKTALEKTIKSYGPYKMTEAKFMTEKRQLYEIQNETGELSVMYLDTKPELEESLSPIRIPVDKNLGGYRVMLIREKDQEKFSKINTLDEFRKISIGLGYGWIDVDILKSNNFKVVTGSSYEGLFKMLVNNRFDAFSRSSVEILDEYEKRKPELKDLKIEDSLLLYYPLPMYFWFSKGTKGRLLAKRAKEGMEMMIDDGTYDKIFIKYHGHKTEKLWLRKRKVFKIENPFLVPETPFEDSRLWYNPINK